MAFLNFSKTKNLSIIGLLIPIGIVILLSRNIGFMHILHFAFPPENFYKPIVSDSFHFWEKEYEKEYQVSFKYTDNYIIGFKDRNEKIPKEWKFTGKIEVIIYHNGKQIKNIILDRIDTMIYSKNTMKFYTSVNFSPSFDVPINKKYKKDLVIKIKVLEPDKELEKFKNSLELVLQVNPSP